MANYFECVLICRGSAPDLAQLRAELFNGTGRIDFSRLLPITQLELDDDGLPPQWWHEGAFGVRERAGFEADLTISFRTAGGTPIEWLNVLQACDGVEDVELELLFGSEFGDSAGRRVWFADRSDESSDFDIDDDPSAVYRFAFEYGWDFGWRDPELPADSTDNFPALGTGVSANPWCGPEPLHPGLMTWSEREELVQRTGQLAFLREFAKHPNGLRLLSELTTWPPEEVDEVAALRTEDLLAKLATNPDARFAIDRNRATAEIFLHDRLKEQEEFLS